MAANADKEKELIHSSFCLCVFLLLQRLIGKKHCAGAYGNAPPFAVLHLHLADARRLSHVHASAIGCDDAAMGLAEKMQVCLQRHTLAVALHKRAAARHIGKGIVSASMQKPHKIFVIRAYR